MPTSISCDLHKGLHTPETIFFLYTDYHSATIVLLYKSTVVFNMCSEVALALFGTVTY